MSYLLTGTGKLIIPMNTSVQETIVKFFTLLILALLSLPSFGQQPKLTAEETEKRKKEAERIEPQAKQLMQEEKYVQALELYKKLDSLCPNIPDYIYQLGVCYINLDYNWKALPYLEQCNKRSSVYPIALSYYLARSYHLSHRFQDAIKYYEKYRNQVKRINSKTTRHILSNLSRQIQMCRNGIALMQHRNPIEVFSMSAAVNSPYPEYGPVISPDEKQIIFTSNRPNTTGGQRDEATGYYYEDIYVSYKSDTGWSVPAKMEGSISTAGHDASISLSPSGNKLIIYRYGKEKVMSKASGDLYICEWDGTSWQQAIPLPSGINTKGWEPSASMTEDENIFYFTSNRSGGHGGTDIYRMKKLPNGEWALPYNLGKTINTPYDEDSPYISPDGNTLYFSSNGHNSMGGYDIFVSRYNKEKNEWSKPENAGYPISTAHEDLYFSWSRDGRRVYFSSIRPEGAGDKDLYYAILHENSAETLVMKGVIYDSSTIEPLAASIKVTDKNTNELVGIFNSNMLDGHYLILLREGRDYDIVIQAENYEDIAERVNLTELHDYNEITKDIHLNRMKE